ncbi:MAG: nicotinate-nucleotide diphosphorylase (carboxylating) [Gammaproteobacteria bacterium]|nr:nicotinate-nucleotide diphosphorylase (carboxylating) [Gammaproteobacteria bacterium]
MRNHVDYFENLDATVKAALDEDIGSGDITAELIDENNISSATVITRDNAVVCGRPWVDKVFSLVDAEVEITWLVDEGDPVAKGTQLFTVQGATRSLLTCERTALNFLQTLSATATETRRLTELVAHTGVKLLDTRKTIPGLRLAQKYSVRTGGGHNHRIGLFDAFLVKENHIAASGSISEAVRRARKLSPDARLEIEVEDIDQLRLALDSQPDWIMLDNFTVADVATAVKEANQAITLEASGGIEKDHDLIKIAETGVDCISIGALTKHCRAIDLSMLLD